MLFNIPYANEAMFPSHIARDTHQKRDYHNERLAKFCSENSIPLTDICSHLQNEHLGDELHPNEAGAKMIAGRVFEVLTAVHKSKGDTRQ
jgi:lysophospholipase L1-like esterase